MTKLTVFDENRSETVRGGRPTAEQLQARIKWVELLRSGKYSQRTSALSSADGTQRCCLGVACDPYVTGLELDTEITMSAQDDIDSGIGNLGFATKDRYGDEYVETTILPPSIAEALGFSTSYPYVFTQSSYCGWNGLTEMNDRGASFEEIAQDIEDTHIKPYLEEDNHG